MIKFRKNFSSSLELFIRGLPQCNHFRRQSVLLLLVGTLCVVNGVGWAICYILFSKWVLSLIFIFLALLGTFSIRAAFRGSLKIEVLFILHLLLLTCVFVSLIDFPVEGISKSAHAYFLVFAVGCLVFFKYEKTYVKTIIPLLSCILYIIFDVTDISFSSEYLHPPVEIMVYGAYINKTMAIMSIFFTLVIARSNYTNEKFMRYKLYRAVKNKQLMVHYQPQINRHGKVASAEALLRWKDPSGSYISPDVFIPVAEASGLILPIGYWVLNCVLEHISMMSHKYTEDSFSVAINVSPVQLNDDLFPQTVLNLLQLYNVSARRIKLEITESTVIVDKDKALLAMRQLDRAGIIWSLDDFGTGYSSLNILSEMPFKEVKIDKSLIKGIREFTRKKIIIQKIIELSKKIDITVVAEGVETSDLAKLMQLAGCDLQQGFLYSKPVPFAELCKYIENRNTSTGGIDIGNSVISEQFIQ